MIMRFMNKKGEDARGPGAIIAAVIAVFVLSIVILALWSFFTGRLPFFEYLPDFNDTKQGTVDLEIFRYALSDGKLQFYDGVRWNDIGLGKKIEFNEREFDYKTLKEELTSSFLFKSKTHSFVGSNYQAIIFPSTVTHEISFWQGAGQIASGGLYDPTPTATSLVKGGQINLGYIHKDPEKRLFIPLDSTDLYYQKGSSVERIETDANGYIPVETDRDLPDFLRSHVIRKEMDEWRDSQINNLVSIRYKDSEGKDQSVDTCYLAERYFVDKTLVVDLTKQGGTCPY